MFVDDPRHHASAWMQHGLDSLHLCCTSPTPKPIKACQWSSFQLFSLFINEWSDLSQLKTMVVDGCCCLDSTGNTHPFKSITCCSVETDTKLASAQVNKSSRLPVRNGHVQGFLFRPQNLVSNEFEVMTQAKRTSCLERRCQR